MYPVLAVLALAALGGTIGVGLELSHSSTFDKAPKEVAGEAMFAGEPDELKPAGPPGIAINGPRVHIDWSTAEYADGVPNAEYSVLVLTAKGTFEEVWCENDGIVEEPKTMTCDLDAVALMSEPFGLYYGDSISAKIQGSNQDGQQMSEVGTSEGTLAPYITGQIEFGYHKYGYYPFDEVNGAYPTADQLAELDLSADLSLTTIRIQERATSEDHHRLHGIQLGFANGSETPFFKGLDTGEEETVVTLELDPSKEITGISMKSWRDALSGLRLLDEDGEYIVDYTWQPAEASGAWSDVQQIPEGQSIIGLIVNEPQTDIFRVGFLLWERFPTLDADLDLNV